MLLLPCLLIVCTHCISFIYLHSVSPDWNHYGQNAGIHHRRLMIFEVYSLEHTLAHCRHTAIRSWVESARSSHVYVGSLHVESTVTSAVHSVQDFQHNSKSCHQQKFSDDSAVVGYIKRIGGDRDLMDFWCGAAGLICFDMLQ